MRSISGSVAVAALLTLSAGGAALAQTPYYDDLACRQYADQQTAPLRQQAGANAVGSTLLGAGLGAALGGAFGGGRGAGIGAASGAIVGAGSGAAQAQYSAAYIQQQYNAYYSQCMAARQAQYREPPPGSAPGYAPPAGSAPGYAPPSGAAPYPGSAADQLNQQEMNQYSQPAYPGYPPQH
ncbi:MAG TPA: hypothetical protein VMF86_17905 [Stellaceae bacterium]|nr:hypothetical protein [Stellaceae bacterium]